VVRPASLLAIARWGPAIAPLLVGLALIGCSDDDRGEATVEFVQLEDSRLVKVQTVGLAAFGPINPHTAIPAHAAAAFGEPSSVARRGELCRRRWPDLGLTMGFGTSGGDDPCGSDAGIEAIRVAGRSAVDAGWRTAEGIRPGMPVAAARRRYPDARRAGGELVLVEGPEAADSQEIVTVLAVETAAGTVTAMTFPIGAGRPE
jgi:hypothetical protein